MGFTSSFSDISNPPNRVYLARAGHKFGFFGFIHGFTEFTHDGDAAAADGNYDPLNPTPTSGTVCSTISFFTLSVGQGDLIAMQQIQVQSRLPACGVRIPIFRTNSRDFQALSYALIGLR